MAGLPLDLQYLLTPYIPTQNEFIYENHTSDLDDTLPGGKPFIFCRVAKFFDENPGSRNSAAAKKALLIIRIHYSTQSILHELLESKASEQNR